MKINKLLLQTDSYKHSHAWQYPKDAEVVESYVAPRGGIYPKVLFFGLQRFIKKHLLTPVTAEDVEYAKKRCALHGVPFNEAGWKYIVDVHGGHLPVSIRAVPEGTLVDNKNVLVTIRNTDPKCFWLTSFLETALIRAVWYPTDVATTSFRIKKIIKGFLEETGDPALLPFKLHDFGARGVSSGESAAIGGLAHLVNFMGSDTMEALEDATDYYHCEMAGYSIPASEHSTITSWGRHGELQAYENMVKNFAGPGKLYACVSDSYDIFAAAKELWGTRLKDLVINSGGTLVVRPDSGDPVSVTLRVMQILWERFGGTINSKGFKVLHPSVRIIQGDGVNETSIKAILLNFQAHGFSADNIAFGMGGALLQAHTRDDNKWAMKASAMRVTGGEWLDVYKDPVTDSGKASFRGRLELVKDWNGKYHTYKMGECGLGDFVLRDVYTNGRLLIDETLDQIRERTNQQ